MSLLSFLGASLTGTSLLLRGSHGAFSFRKGWPASLHPIPPPPLPIRTGTPAIPPRSISPWSSRRTHTPHIPPSEEVAVAACAGRVEVRRCSRTRPFDPVEAVKRNRGKRERRSCPLRAATHQRHQPPFTVHQASPCSASGSSNVAQVAQASRSRPHSQNSFPVKNIHQIRTWIVQQMIV